MVAAPRVLVKRVSVYSAMESRVGKWYWDADSRPNFVISWGILGI